MGRSRTNAWIVELMDVQADDRLLEVGFGPGVAIALLAERALNGFVAGVDPSEVMLRQAVRRNRAAIRAGRVELRLGSVTALPYQDEFFTKVCAIHSLYFWPSLDEGLAELRRVLVPDGLMVLAVRMRRERAGPFDPSRYGLTDEDVARIEAALKRLGFHDVRSRCRNLGPETVTVVLAQR
jgi:ubiquinone/menaquinone biosynthesis C-methylase UbiE